MRVWIFILLTCLSHLSAAKNFDESLADLVKSNKSVSLAIKPGRFYDQVIALASKLAANQIGLTIRELKYESDFRLPIGREYQYDRAFSTSRDAYEHRIQKRAEEKHPPELARFLKQSPRIRFIHDA